MILRRSGFLKDATRTRKVSLRDEENEMIPGLHIMWTRPKIARGQKVMEDYEVTLLAASALAYRSASGRPIKLYTDRAGLEFFGKQHDILWVWDEVDTHVLDRFDQECVSFPPSSYENAGKMHILCYHPLPFLYIDNDAVLYEKIPADLIQLDLVYGHREIPPDISQLPIKTKGLLSYPDPSKYAVPPGYQFNPKFDWTNSPVMNTCLLYFNSAQLQLEFRDELERFLYNNTAANAEIYKIAQYLFLDQRLLGLILGAGNYSHSSFLSVKWDMTKSDFEPDEKRGPHASVKQFHHLWLSKRFMGKSRISQEDYISKLIQHLSSLDLQEDFKRLAKSSPFSVFDSLRTS